MSPLDRYGKVRRGVVVDQPTDLLGERKARLSRNYALLGWFDQSACLISVALFFFLLS